MNVSPSFVRPLGVGLLVYIALGVAHGGITLAPGPEVSPSSSPAAASSTGPFDKVALQREFERAQARAISALLYKQKRETDELKANQKARRKEWIEKEKQARHKYLAENHKGPEIRTYMRDYQSRLKALDKMLIDERTQRARENEARFDAEKKDQAAKHREFVEALSRGERPPQSLWPM